MREFGATGTHDFSREKHVHIIGFDILQQSLVMGDDNGGILFGLQLVHTGCYHPKGIYVES